MQVARIAGIKQEEQDREYYDKYYGIFAIAIKFFKSQHVMLYGGTAIDEYLPEKSKIYGPYQLPDIDVFSIAPKQVAYQLMTALEKKGLDAFVSNALHPGTFKVYSSGLQIADISYIDRSEYNHLRRGSSVGPMGIRMVPTDFLKFTLHGMLATSNPQRWEKVYSRLSTFYKVYTPPSCGITKHLIPISKELSTMLNTIHKYTETTKCVLLGTPVIASMLSRNISYVKDLPFNIALVKEDPAAFAHTMITQLNLQNMSVGDVRPHIDHLIQPRHVVVFHDKTPVAIFFEAESKCFAFNTYKTVRVATVHTVLMIYLGMMLNQEFKQSHEVLKCVTNELTRVLLKNTSKKKIMRPLSLTCLGEEAGLATMRRIKNNK